MKLGIYFLALLFIYSPLAKAARWEREYKLVSYFLCGRSFDSFHENILDHEYLERNVDLRSTVYSQPGKYQRLFDFRWYINNQEHLYQLLKITPMSGPVPTSYDERSTKFKDYFISAGIDGQVPLPQRQALLETMMSLIEVDLIRLLESVTLEKLKHTVESDAVNRAHLAVYGKNALLERESSCDFIQNETFKKAYRKAGDTLIEAFATPGDPRPGIEDNRTRHD